MTGIRIEKIRLPQLLTDKTEMAKAMNFSKYPVLTWDIDNKKGSLARVGGRMTQSGMMYTHCKLEMDYYKEGDGIYYLSTKATMLKGHYGVEDHLESAEFANAPIIESNQDVAILIYSLKANMSAVLIVNSGRVDGSYSSACKFEHTGPEIEREAKQAE